MKEELHLKAKLSMFFSKYQYFFFLKLRILKQIVGETQKWDYNFVRPSGSKVTDLILFWSITQELFDLK